MKKSARNIHKLIAFVILLIITACNTGFQNEDIKNVKESIRNKFSERQGVTVAEVQMIKESPRKLIGFVKLKVEFYGTVTEVTKDCTATMGENNEYLWKCN